MERAEGRGERTGRDEERREDRRETGLEGLSDHDWTEIRATDADIDDGVGYAVHLPLQ
jgi:hypothetical protein